MRSLKIIVLLLLISTTSYAQGNELKKLARWMSGTFSSYDQHMMDTANYYHIKLDIVPIWQERTDGYWFYVEQALAGYESKPYRQRVYHLWQNQWGELVSSIYKFPDPKRFAEKWADFEVSMSVKDITLKDGCDVILNFDHDQKAFVGGTKVGTCISKRSGSAYATAEVEIYKNELYSWDRGFDASGNYVWGAEKSGYIFLKE